MFRKISEFFQEVKLELKKVVFPTRKEVVGSTWVVITTVFLVSFFLGIIDLGLSKLVGVLVK
jgi:preprotein translocase subunit SecE